jgi:hypothetical protein
MASVVYNRFFMNLALKALSWSADDIRVALVSSAYTPTKSDTWWTSGVPPYTNEIVGSAYTAGGLQLASATSVQDDTNSRVMLDGNDVTWQTSTITAHNAVLYDSSITNKDLIACYQFTQDYSSANGSFTIQWSSSGLIELKQGT